MNIKIKNIGAIFLLSLPILSFGEMFSSKNQKIMSFEDNLVGTLYKGTPISKNKNGYSLKGWVMDGNEYIIFLSTTQRIKLARIDESFQKDLNVSKQKEDEYGITWKKVSLDFKLNKPKIVKNQDNLWIEEKELYTRCGSCHKAHPFDEYTPNQWPPIIKTMKDNAGFTKKEANKVSKYLQYQSIKGE